VETTATGTEVVVYGTADLHIYDSEGNHTGPRSDSDVHGFQVPRIGYEIGQGVQVAMLQAGAYTIKVTGTQAEGVAMLRMNDIQQGEVTRMLVFERMPTTATSEASITMDVSEFSTDLELVYKPNESSPEESIGVLSLLEGEESQDLVPPVTTITI
jgi:hypothetical protein